MSINDLEKTDTPKIEYYGTNGQVRPETSFLPSKDRLFRSRADLTNIPNQNHTPLPHIIYPQIIK
jgi:hypothetical protein